MPDLVYSGQRLIASESNVRAPFTVGYTPLTTNATADAAGAEAVWLTSTSVTLRTGRAYRLTLKGLAVATVANTDCQLRVRRAALGGSLMFDSFRFALPSTANIAFYFANIIAITAAADITTVLACTISRAAGTGLVTVNASSVNVAYIHTEDVGPATEFAGATAIS
ncbi:hypothetical protein [Streptomyces sp. NPDC060198]|uniref:hypothetical protein n=1 Tax=Streptomyces sp. NPDC060198 TaxID=3347070 RepID=UPI003663CA38